MKSKLWTLILSGLLNILMLSFISCDKEEEMNEVSSNNDSGSVKDIEGNVYKTIVIGDQEWMAENLKTSTLNDGTIIPEITSNTDWINSTSPAYCWYINNKEEYSEKYGALYNWYTVETEKLCPDGWHVPSNEEWFELDLALGMDTSYSLVESESNYGGWNVSEWDYWWRESSIGSKLAGTAEYWEDGELKEDINFNDSGFNALPAGMRERGRFMASGTDTFFWTSSEAETDAWMRKFYSDATGIILSPVYKHYGYSVRCIKNK